MSDKDADRVDERKILNDTLIEEWKVLRDEIARKQSFVERLILTTVAGTLAIFSYAFSLQEYAPANAFIALLPMFLATMSYFWILRNLYSGFRISRYIKEFIEPKTALNWETWVNRARPRTRPGAKAEVGTDVFATYHDFLLVVSLIVCIVLIWVSRWPFASIASQTGTGTTQVQRLPTDVCAMLTIGVVFFWIIWYLIAKQVFVARTRRGIQKLIQEMQESDT